MDPTHFGYDPAYNDDRFFFRMDLNTFMSVLSVNRNITTTLNSVSYYSGTLDTPFSSRRLTAEEAEEEEEEYEELEEYNSHVTSVAPEEAEEEVDRRQLSAHDELY
jgi:hypothetical protein